MVRLFFFLAEGWWGSECLVLWDIMSMYPMRAWTQLIRVVSLLSTTSEMFCISIDTPRNAV